MRNLFVRTGTTQGAAGSMTVKLMKNGIDTALTITIAAGQLAGTFSSTSTDIPFSRGDTAVLKFTNNHTGASAILQGFSIQCK